jgi:hypothetical protein
MVRIRPTSAESSFFLNLNELELYDSGGAKLPSSSLTVFISTFFETTGLPGGRSRVHAGAPASSRARSKP